MFDFSNPHDIIGLCVTALIVAAMIFGLLFALGDMFFAWISDAITRKQIYKLAADPTKFTPKKGIKIARLLKKYEDLSAYNFGLLHMSTQAKQMDLPECAELCKKTEDQIVEAFSLVIKICSPPLQDKLDAGSCRTLAFLLNRLVDLQRRAVDLDFLAFQPLVGLENTKAAKEAAENSLLNLIALHDECSSILSGLNGVLEVATTAVCAPISAAKPTTKHAKTAFDQVCDAAKKCKSASVKMNMDKLIAQLTVYLESAPEGTDLTNRINSYYLPTLALVLQDLSAAEKKKSKTIEVREALCLKTIETVSNILDTHQESEGSADLINITAEVDALHNMAALKGDISSAAEFKTLSR